MLELFTVKNSAGKIVFRTDDKQKAKETRDNLGGIEKGFHVSRGKDNLPSPRGFPSIMRRQP